MGGKVFGLTHLVSPRVGLEALIRLYGTCCLPGGQCERVTLQDTASASLLPAPVALALGCLLVLRLQRKLNPLHFCLLYTHCLQFT